MAKNSLIRTLYLYIFALLGLTLVTIGGVRLVNLGLKVFVFTQADADQKLYNTMPAPYPLMKDGSVTEISTSTALTAEQKTALESWRLEYQRWQTENKNINYLTSRRQQDVSMSLALILIGLPLYFYHWGVIRKENKLNNSESQSDI